MLKYSRNKLVSVVRKDKNILAVHGVLDDDIYSLDIDVSISISDLKIVALNGKWRRWTTPECPRAESFLQEAVGFRIEDGFTDKIHKIIGRKACRHFANLLIECCFSAKDAASIAKWDEAKKTNSDLTYEKFLEGSHEKAEQTALSEHIEVTEKQGKKDAIKKAAPADKIEGGMLIDLHVHTSEASPCSSAPVDMLIKEAHTIGIDGICITDHNYVWSKDAIDALRQKHGFMVLAGNEITTDQGDMLVFGMYRDIKGIIKIEDLKREVENADGFIIVAHPFRGFLNFNVGDLGLTPEKAMKRSLFKYVDAVEVMNGKVTQKENLFALQVAEGLGLPVTGGSDAHEVTEVGRYVTRFDNIVKDEHDLLDALKSGNYSPVAYRKEKGLV